MSPSQPSRQRGIPMMKKEDKAIRLAEREGLCSVANNTKWRKWLATVRGLPCEKRVKYIDCGEPTEWKQGFSQPHPNHVEPSHGPVHLKFLEWIEIKRHESQGAGRLLPPRLVDHSDEIRKALLAGDAPFEETPESFLVRGYTRPRHQP